jgi:hypothetical protein
MADHRRQAERDLVAKGVKLPALAPKTAIATPDTRPAVQGFIEDIAPAMTEGRTFKFDGKRGAYVTNDDETVIGDDIDFIAICDEVLAGRIRFNGEGQPPTKIMGLPYHGFQMPKREDLGDTDPSKWELGLVGKPQDPWLQQVCLPLQRCDNFELFVFVTTSITGRRAVGNLLRTYERSQRTYPDDYLLIRCKIGGFKHKDTRVGMVKVPVLAVVGRAPKDGSIKPNASIAADMNDAIPF